MSTKELSTERINPRTADIDRLDTLGVLERINDEDGRVAPAVPLALLAVARAVDLAVERWQRGGRVVLFGSGTSGRLAGGPDAMVYGDLMVDMQATNEKLRSSAEQLAQTQRASACTKPMAAYASPQKRSSPYPRPALQPSVPRQHGQTSTPSRARQRGGRGSCVARPSLCEVQGE
ncbi:MAG: hypothetical protein M3069_24595 [Chloroflexota bacterium]|nr:hypothetical protein [Chloroflexota bacterium]